MLTTPATSNSKENLPTTNTDNEILRFDLSAETKGEQSGENIDLSSGSVINMYPSVALEKCAVYNPTMDESDVLEQLKKLENLGNNKLPIFTCDSVEIYFIEPNGVVKSTLAKEKLIIFKVDGDPAETIFLSVGDWIYPLFSAISPCYRSEENIFVFPDIYSETENAAVALILSKTASEAFHEVLGILLDSEESRARRSTAIDSPVSISDNLNSGTSYLARNLVRASTNLAGYMDSATSTIMQKMQPQTQKSVNPNLQSLANVAVTVTGSAASAAGYLSSNLGHAVTALGRYISPYVSKKLKETVPAGAVEFSLGTLRGVGNIYNGLEESAGILAQSMSNNTVKLVEHRYGQPVGQVTNDVLSTVRNIYTARRNLSVWKPTSIAKGMLRSAGDAMLEDRRNLKQTQSFQGLQGQAALDPLNNT